MGVKARAPAREIRVLNDKCAFVPRVQVVASKGRVKTSSQDPVLHTTTVQLPDGRQLFNVALPVPGMEIAKPLAGAGALRVSCSTHQWMRGVDLVTDDVAVVTGPDGRFTLSDVPPGTYQLRVWHEALKAADQTVTVVAGKSIGRILSCVDGLRRRLLRRLRRLRRLAFGRARRSRSLVDRTAP